MLRFGLLHRRSNTDIAKLIEEPTDGLIKQLFRLSRGIPDTRGFQSSGVGVNLEKKLLKLPTLYSFNVTPWA